MTPDYPTRAARTTDFRAILRRMALTCSFSALLGFSACSGADHNPEEPLSSPPDTTVTQTEEANVVETPEHVQEQQTLPPLPEEDTIHMRGGIRPTDLEHRETPEQGSPKPESQDQPRILIPGADDLPTPRSNGSNQQNGTVQQPPASNQNGPPVRTPGLRSAAMP